MKQGRLTGAALIAALLVQSLSSAAARQAGDPPAAPPPIVVTGAYQPQDKDERGLWMQMDEEERKLKASNFVIRDAALNAYVNDVFCRTVGPRCKEVRIYVMRTPYFNANIAPNGMMQLWSGLLLRTRDEAQLAAVLSHEYMHYQDRHSLQLFRQLKVKAASATFFAFFGLVGSLLALGQISALMQFSRDQEAAADAGSVELLHKAGSDATAASRIWEQFREEADATAVARKMKSRKDKNGGLFASHPPTADRVAALKAQAQALPDGGAGRSDQERYRAALGAFWASLIDDQIKLNDFGATEFLIAHLASDGWTPALSYARGELYRSRGAAADLTAAVGYYRAACADAGAPIESWRGLGLSLLRTGDPEGGRAALKTYLDHRPDAPDRPMIAMLAGV
jgi:predicted Zn-dependent protease